jgi:carboxypeptidase family protein
MVGDISMENYPSILARGRLSLLIFGTLLIAAFVGASSCCLWSQSATTGALRGTVVDPKGAVVPGVTVTLTNITTGRAQVTTTDTNGLYGFSLLSPGTYEVDFSAQGFKVSRAMSVVVNVSEAPELDAQLEAGTAEEAVNCKCQLSQMATSSNGTLVDSKTITAVPLTTRNFTQVMSMSSGSAAAVNNAGLLGAGSQSANVNGNTDTGRYTVDGAASGTTVPNPDTISEFKIQTSQYDSEYGARVPNTNLITRSGENQFHGDAWEFVRNDIFNANAFFRNAAGQPRANLKQNQFGGTIGGPIKKDKLFFFSSYQGTRQVNGLDPDASLSTLLLPPLTNDRSAATIGSQFCPANKGPAMQPKYLTFAGGVQVACDGSNINPVALNLLQLKLSDGSYAIPTPQTILSSGANAGLGFSSYSLPSTYYENQYLLNVDYVISKKQTLSGRFYDGTANTLRSFGTNFFRSPETPNTPGFPEKAIDKDYISSVKLTSVLTSNVANEARITFTLARTDETGPGVPSAASIGMTPATPLFPEPPDFTIRGSLGGFRVGNIHNDYRSPTKTYSGGDTLSWVHGKHTIRTGVFVFRQDLQSFSSQSRGRITFQNFTDFLLGMNAAQNSSPQGFSNIQSIEENVGLGPRGEVVRSYEIDHGSAFVQDDTKITSRLTLNLGVRWEYLPPSWGPDGDLGNAWPSLLQLVPIPPPSGTYVGTTVPANYNPNQINPYTGQPFGPPPAGVFVRPTKSYYANGGPLDSFAPLFGLAWQPGSKQTRVVVRAGYGWFYQLPSDGGNAPNTAQNNTQPFAQLFSNTGASNSASTLQKPFPTTTLGFVLRTPASRLTDRVVGPDFRIPKLQQWSLNVQYRLSPSLALDLGYVGSNGNNLLLAYDSNQPLLATPGHPVNCGLPNTPTGLGLSAAGFAAMGVDASGCVTTNTSGNAYLRVPIVGETPTALQAHQSLGASWYHSMQATFRQQISRGLTFQFAYTFSKSEANTTVYNDQRNLNLDWARTSFDRTHRVITNFSYDLPSLRTKGFRGAMLGGWSISGIVIVQSGLPMSLTDRNGGSVYGFAGPATITLCPGATYKDLVTSGTTGSRLHNWINRSAICNAPALGSDGSLGYGNAGQSIANGPGQFNTDFSIGKTTTVRGLREGAQLAFRVEFYNALNRPQFSNPGTTLGTANFGVITQTSVAPRLIQFGLKYLF